MFAFAYYRVFVCVWSIGKAFTSDEVMKFYLEFFMMTAWRGRILKRKPVVARTTPAASHAQLREVTRPAASFSSHEDDAVISKAVPARAGTRSFAVGIAYITEHAHKE